MKEVNRIFRNSCKLGLLFVFLLACRFWAQGLTAWLASGGMKAQFKAVIFSMLILGACLVGISSHYFSYEEKRVEKEGLSILDGLFILCFFGLARLFLWLGLPVLEHFLGPSLVGYEAGLLATAKQISQQFFAAGLLYVMIISLVLPILEELIFRGFMTYYFFQPQDKLVLALLSSALFALGRFPTTILAFLFDFGLGLIFYGAYCRQGRLRDAIWVHILVALPSSLFILISIYGDWFQQIFHNFS